MRLFHFSQDPTITEFVPHVALTAKHATPYVWAVDESRAPAYWFPRQCPRITAWAVPESTPQDVALILNGRWRMHAIEERWLEAMHSVTLFRYELPGDSFALIDEPSPSSYVSTSTVRPLAPPTAVGDLVAVHEAAAIELRVLPDLDELVDAVQNSSLGFSGIRLGNRGKGVLP